MKFKQIIPLRKQYAEQNVLPQLQDSCQSYMSLKLPSTLNATPATYNVTIHYRRCPGCWGRGNFIHVTGIDFESISVAIEINIFRGINPTGEYVGVD